MLSWVGTPVLYGVSETKPVALAGHGGLQGDVMAEPLELVNQAVAEDVGVATALEVVAAEVALVGSTESHVGHRHRRPVDRNSRGEAPAVQAA